MNTFQQGAVEAALKKLFSQSYFDICTINKIGETIGVNPKQSPNYSALSLLHCVNYSDMPSHVKNELPNIVVEVLAPGNSISRLNFKDMANTFVPSNYEVEAEGKKVSWLRRLK